MTGRASIAASLIVRDEEAVIGRCLESIAPFVDAAVVVDTGSVDETRSIARSHGAEIVEFDWCDDFSAARNAGLDRVTCEFVLYIDADEVLVDAENADVPLELSAAGYRVLLQARPGHSPYREHRIFRADPSIRFHGVIHESIVEALYEYAIRTNRPVIDTDLLLTHDGYEGAIEHKAERNIPLLRRQIESQPDRSYLRHDLGVSLYVSGRFAEARQAFLDGVDLVRRRGAKEPIDVVNYVHLAGMLGDDGLEILHEAERLFPKNPRVAWAIAERALESGDPEVVIEQLAPLTDWTEADMIATDLAHDLEMFGPDLYRVLGDSAITLGRWEDAVRWLARLEELDPDDPGHRVKRQLAEARSRAVGTA
jgi:glycosyltransferase involved in cell wall biosynthesis